jgi:hypothetical protein
MSGIVASPEKADAQYIIGATATVTVSQNTITPGEPVIITIQYLDEDGNPIPGAVIHFTIIAGPPGAAVGSRTVAKVTDADGIATANLRTAEGETGNVILQMSDDAGNILGTTVVRIVASQPTTPSQPGPSTGPSTSNGGPSTGPSGNIVPPNTGDAGLLGSTSIDPVGPASLVLFVVLLTLAMHIQSRPATEGEVGSADN